MHLAWLAKTFSSVAILCSNLSTTLNSIIRLNKISDKLEQRIASLEKVLASHAKCIGEMREEKKDDA